jgi:hypothetical protein
MSLWRIAWKYLCGRLLASGLTAVSVALGDFRERFYCDRVCGVPT